MSCLYLPLLVLFVCVQAFAKTEESENFDRTSNVGDAVGKQTQKISSSKIPAGKTVDSMRPIPVASLFQTQPTRFRQDFSTLPVVINADRVSKLLRKLANEDMGVYAMQAILDGMLYLSDNFDHTDDVRRIADAIDLKLDDAKKIVLDIQRAVLALFSKSPIDVQLFRQFRECCALDKKWLTFSSRYSCRVNTSLTCDILPQRRLSAFSFYPGKDLTPVFARHAERDSAIRWQYFMTADGVHTEFPAHSFDDRHNFSRCLTRSRLRRWNAFVAAALPFSKTVIVIIDRGSGVSSVQLETAKCVAKSMVSSLNDKDRVAVLAIGGSVSHFQSCQQQNQRHQFQFASHAAKAQIFQYIDSTARDGERTNHTLAFETAFNTIEQLLLSYPEVGQIQDIFPTIVYVSRGLLTEITEAKQVLAAIMDGAKRVGGIGDESGTPKTINPVQINTVALMEYGKLIMWETQFLQDVATQNFSKYKLTAGTGSLMQDEPINGNGTPEGRQFDIRSTPGKMLVVNASANGEVACVSLPDVVSLFEHSGYDRWNSNSNSDVQASKVQFILTDDSFEPAFLSGVVSVHFEGRFIGVAGVDLALSDLLSPAVYFNSADTSSYVIVTDVNGLVLYHPKLNQDDSRMRPDLSSAVPFSWVEGWPKGDKQHQLAVELQQAISNQWYGFFDYEVDDAINGSRQDRNYYWHKTADRSFTFVISAVEGPPNQYKKLGRPDTKVYIQHSMTYHRLDFRLNKDIRLCYHGKSLASFERAGIFLSPRAFDRPYDRRTITETKQSAQGYWAYTTDDTRLITNPGLKHGIRHEVGAFSKIAAEWKKQAEKSNYRLSIIRRYLATPSGILLSFPATVIDQRFDPLTSAWYQNALQNPGRVMLSESRLDPNGLGNLVTLSHTVYEGKAAMHQPGDAVLAVMALDVPLTFVYQLLHDSLSVCRENNIDCFLFNDRGYVVANRNAVVMDDLLPQANGQPANFQAQQQAPVEMMHLAHREPSVASEVLQRKGFAVKMSCFRYSDQTVQRYYIFNSSFSDVLRSSDGCIRYQIAAISQTNVFLAIVNKSCHRHASFCPCSVNDRRCLNCNKGTVEPSESWCECPCECPLNLLDEHRLCRSQSATSNADTPDACQSPPTSERSAQLDGQFLANMGGGLSPCLPIHCGDFDTESTCRGVMGCEWCSYNADGREALTAPYCTSLNSCFGGVQGLAAYSEEDVAYDPIAVATPVGPVAGGIMGIFVLLVAGVYWYRHHVLRLVESRHSRYGSSGSASCLQRFDDSAEDYHFDDGSGGAANGDDKGLLNGNALLLASFERENLGVGQAPRPRYRPGPRTESSDHGYSTMTGNCDDSEQATTIEPLGSGGRIGGKILLRWHGIIGNRTKASSKPEELCKTVNATAEDVANSTEVPGSTVLPNTALEPNADDPLQTSVTSDNSLSVPECTNIVTMALIHHQPSVVES